MKKMELPELRTNPSGPTWGKLPLWLLSVAALVSFALPVSAKIVGLDVMPANVYVGGDISRVMALNPSDPNYFGNLVTTVAGIYDDIVDSDPPARLHALAKEIVKRRPDIVAVMEASLIRVQSPGDLAVGGTTPATEVVYDYLQILVTELEALGAHYQVVSTANEVDVELPMLDSASGRIDDVRLSDREAILVRSDLSRDQLRVSNPRSGNFANVIEIPALGLAVERGWCSVDVAMSNRNFRFVCAHLEQETAPQLQALQVEELLAGPAKPRYQVILVGDFNTDALHRDGSFAYDLIPAAGFTDAWAKLHPKTPAGGLTWGHDAWLADATTLFDRRIDFVFSHGKNLVPVQADVVDIATGLTEPPFWASDHAALSVKFKLKK